jgi:FkbM family methyltransferase
MSLRKTIYYRGRLLLDGVAYFRHFSPIEASRIYLSLLLGTGTVTVSMRELMHPIQLRTDTSDLSVFRQLLIDRCYDFQRELSPDLIIDCGANIGLFSVLAANRFPGAHIVAIEPEESNFELLKRNTSPYTNIECLHAGIWSRKCRLRIKDRNVGSWAYQVEESAEETASSFESVTIGDLLRRSGFETIDLLKIDIEGAELEVFNNSYGDWIGAFKLMIVEVHDGSHAACSEAVRKAISGCKTRWFRRGNNYFIERVE